MAVTQEKIDIMFLTPKQREIGKECILNYIECFHKALWWRQFRPAGEVVKCIETIRGLKGLLNDKQVKWLAKAKKLLSWVLLPENYEFRKKWKARKQSRGSRLYLDWRLNCLERDNSKCRICSIKQDLHVHHVKEYVRFPEDRLKVDNGIVLCKNCHKIEHRK